MDNKKEYYIGLDMGTNSVGWIQNTISCVQWARTCKNDCLKKVRQRRIEELSEFSASELKESQKSNAQVVL